MRVSQVPPLKRKLTESEKKERVIVEKSESGAFDVMYTKNGEKKYVGSGLSMKEVLDVLEKYMLLC